MTGKYNFGDCDITHILDHLSVEIKFYADSKESYGFAEIQEQKCFMCFLRRFWWLLRLYTKFLKRFGRK